MTVSRRLRFEILRRDGHTCRYCGAKAPDVALTVDHVIPVSLGGGDEPSNLVTACSDCNSGKASVPADAAIVEDVAADALRWKRAMEQAHLELHAEQQVMAQVHDQFLEVWNNWTYPVDVEVPAEPLPLTGDPIIDNWHRLLPYRGRHAQPVEFVDGTLHVLAERGWTGQVRDAFEHAALGFAEVLGVPSIEVSITTARSIAAPPSPPRPTKRTVRKTVDLDPNWRDSITRFITLGLSMADLQQLVEVAMQAHARDTFRYFCGCAYRRLSDLHESARRIMEAEDR